MVKIMEPVQRHVMKPWPNGLASRCKFAKPELADGLAMGGQTDSQVGWQVHAHWKKVVNFAHIQLPRDQLASKTFVDLRVRLALA